MEPARIYFGTVRRGQGKVIDVKFQKYSSDEIEIKEIVGRSDALKIQRVDTGFQVSLSDRIPFGIFRDRIVVKTTSKETPIIHLPVFARVNGDVVARPSDVSFGLLEGPLQEEVIREVVLVDDSQQNLEILGVESDTKGLVAEVISKPTDFNKTIQVKLEPGVSGVFHSKVTVKTSHSDPEQATLTIPVYGIVAKKGS